MTDLASKREATLANVKRTRFYEYRHKWMPHPFPSAITEESEFLRLLTRFLKTEILK